MKKKFFYLISLIVIILVSTILTETYLKYVGLGDPIIYDSNFVYGYAPRANQKKIGSKVQQSQSMMWA